VPSLSDRLKALGVKVGASDLPTPPPRKESASLEEALSGHIYHTTLGDTFVVEQRYPIGQSYGQSAIHITAPLDALAVWAGDERISRLPAQAFAFIDTETTGLSGGTGTYAFLIGAGRFTQDEFKLVQFFMRDPTEEPAQLIALEEFLAPCSALVSYNGKAFDIPLLAARYTYHGWQMPFSSYYHIDLLHLSRRLWRDRLASRTLGNIEAHILGALRSEEDVPGWMIPQMYFDYLRSGDPRPLTNVFYHNATDVVSLAALLNHSANLLSDPLVHASQHAVDLLSLARLYEDLGDLDNATRLYMHGLEHLDAREDRIPRGIYLRAIERLALIHKRNDHLKDAVSLWVQAAQHEHIESHIELAKFYEHIQRDYAQAMYWTETAISLLQNRPLSDYDRRVYIPELKHRLVRLQHKLDH
jgi:uncharacterized protein